MQEAEIYILKVEQAPSESMISAITPAMKALIKKELLDNSSYEVKLSVVSCISEITRITAPDTPYDDDVMKVYLFLIGWRWSCFDILYPDIWPVLSTFGSGRVFHNGGVFWEIGWYGEPLVSKDSCNPWNCGKGPAMRGDVGSWVWRSDTANVSQLLHNCEVSTSSFVLNFIYIC